MNNNLEQQKIYIDAEEEITTVVDHLLQTRSSDVVLVVPQHALLLQSVVNLKLLAQEAQKLHKNIIMMTNDVDGISFAQRAGIVTQSYVADDDVDYASSSTSEQKNMSGTMYAQSAQRVNDGNEKKAIGSQAYYAQNQRGYIANHNASVRQSSSHAGVTMNPASFAHEQQNRRSAPVKNAYAASRDNAQSQQKVSQQTHPIAQHVVPRNGNMSVRAQEHQKSDNRAQTYNAQQYVQSTPHEDLSQYEQSLKASQVSDAEVYRPKMRKADIAINASRPAAHQKKSFSQKNVSQKKKKRKKDISHVSGGTGFVLKGFVFAGIFLIVVILLIVILPQTDVSVMPKHITIDDTMDLTAQTDQQEYDGDRRLIPARLIERDMTFTKTFPATGNGDVTAQKAQGTITIYNTYNEQSQPLVATTRFLSEDGMLFRLVNAVTVPGMKDGEPGIVDALVIADEAGEQGNIGPTRFSVPGFVGSPKNDKFYGVSEKSMIGGGTGGSGVAVVTQEDIDNAVKNMNAEIAAYTQEQLTAMLRPESEILTSDAYISEQVRSEANVSPGTMGDSFMYEIVSHVQALVFSQEDVLGVMESRVADDMQQYDMDEIEMILTYDDVSADFENTTLKMTVRGTAEIIATVDANAFKKDIIGQKHDDLLAIMEERYGDTIEKITIERVVPGTPNFLASRISRLGFMTHVVVEE